MKIQCPICGEYIEENTEICPFCNERIKEENKQSEHTEQSGTIEEKMPNESTERKSAEAEFQKPALNLNMSVIISSIIFVLIAITGTYFLVKKYNNVSMDKSLNANNQQIEVQSKQLPKKMDEVRRYFKDKQYEKAAKICEEEIEKNQNPIAYFYLGRIYQEQNYTDLAIENLKKAANLKPDLFEAQYELAKIYYDKAEYDSALEYLNAANKIKANDKEVLEKLVNIYFERENKEKSLEFSRQLIKLNPDNYIANVVLCADAINREDTNSAIKYLKKALEIQYNTSDAIYLAKLYMSKEQYTNAIKVLDKVIDEDYYNYEAKELRERSIILREEYRQNQEYKKQQQNMQHEVQESENLLFN